MQISVLCPSGDTFPIEVSDDLVVGDFKALCEAETAIPIDEIQLEHNGTYLLDDKKSMTNYGVVSGDVIIVKRQAKRNRQTEDLSVTQTGRPQASAAPASSGASPHFMLDFSQIRVPSKATSSSTPVLAPTQPIASTSQLTGDHDPRWIRKMLLKNPDLMLQLEFENPELARNVDDPVKFEQVLRNQQKARDESAQRQQKILRADPMDIEAQRLIEEKIRNENIDQNMSMAMEFNPEIFGTVQMLYINCKVNGYNMKAFVDSGAQTTIFSKKAAERCNIMRLLDPRFQGIAKGVGTRKILGRVHMAQIQIEDVFLMCSLTVIDDPVMEMLLGLDMLKRHQCCIDLKQNVLRLGTGTETPFLSEADIPDQFKNLSAKLDDEDSAETAEALERSKQETAIKVNTEILPTDKFKEDDVNGLVSQGFTREQVILELRDKNGDLDIALSSLFIKYPKP